MACGIKVWGRPGYEQERLGRPGYEQEDSWKGWGGLGMSWKTAGKASWGGWV